MRKLMSLLLVVALVGSLFIGCTKKEEPAAPVVETPKVETPAPAEPQPEVVFEGDLEDGIYFYADSAFDANSGWKAVVTIEVAGGEIVNVDWNGAHISAGKDKKTTSADGEYNMVAYGKAIAEWHEQVALVEAFLLDSQDISALALNDDATTDAVSGVTIKVSEFVNAVNAALVAGPVGPGLYKDGHFFVEADEFGGSGWKENVSVTVINGYVVAANWNATYKDGGKDKKTSSADGDYGMVAKGNATAEWHEQAQKIEAFLVENQNIEAITIIDADTHTDAVSGVTIKVGDFVELVKKALVLR